ncbi:hypothetical protein Hanom_Chr05g00463621 [Helianthus anomalus]
MQYEPNKNVLNLKKKKKKKNLGGVWIYTLKVIIETQITKIRITTSSSSYSVNPTNSKAKVRSEEGKM